MKLPELLKRTSEDDAWPQRAAFSSKTCGALLKGEKLHRESAMQQDLGIPVEVAELGTLPLFDYGGYVT
jgi:hypothetical protein